MKVRGEQMLVRLRGSIDLKKITLTIKAKINASISFGQASDLGLGALELTVTESYGKTVVNQRF